MSRPDPIQYAERLYDAIRAANFSPMSFLAFGNAIKEGVAMRSMPRVAAEPFMRIVGEMLDLEEEVDSELIDAEVAAATISATSPPAESPDENRAMDEQAVAPEGTRSSGTPLGSAPVRRARKQ